MNTRSFQRWLTIILLTISILMPLILPCQAAPSPTINTTPSVNLTDDEKEYIKQNPTVSIAMDTSWIPYANPSKNDTVDGIIPNILEQVCSAVGLEVKYVPNDTYMDAIKTMQRGDTQLVSGIANDPAMAEKNNALITSPYLTINNTAVTKNSIDDLYTANSKKRVAVCVGSYATIAMKEKMPSYTFIEFHSNEECMQAVLDERVDMALIATYAAEYYMSQHAYTSLHSVLINDFNWGLCFGVNPNCDSRLISILNKGIASLSQNDINQAIYAGLIKSSNANKNFWTYFYENPIPAIIIVALIVAVFLIFVNLLVSRHKRTRELAHERELNAQLTIANNTRQDFLSRMSHDLRTPMNAIVGMSNLGYDEATDDTSREYFEKIKNSSTYLLGLVNDVLNMSRIEAGHTELYLEPVNVKQHLDEIIIMVTPLLAEHTVTLDTHFDSITEWVLCDKLRVQQIDMNLLSNAIKFSPPGSTITWEIKHDHIENNRVYFTQTITDEGCGMSEDFLSRLFTPFEQERNTYSDQQEGTGLGLSIVKSLLDAMGGTITCDSQLGKGTTFTITMSLAQAEAPATEATDTSASSIKHADLNGRHILLCEDHPLNTEIAVKLLTKRGMTVTTAADGQAAIDTFCAAEAGTFDAVLMDIRMPKKDGWEATRAIRHSNHPDATSIPILAMTANAYDTDRKTSAEAGMDAHLAKPINPTELYSALEYHIGRTHHVESEEASINK